MVLAPLSAGLQSLPLLPTIKLGPSGADYRVGGLAFTCSRPLWVSPMNSPVRLRVSPAATSTPTGVFNQRFEALFPGAEALCWEACLTPPKFLQVYVCMNVGPQGLLVTLPVLLHNLPPHWQQVLSIPAACLHPSYWSGWMFLLYLLGCWTSTQFDFLSVLVVFVFKLLLSFFWLCEEAHFVYLRLHLGRKPISHFLMAE